MAKSRVSRIIDRRPKTKLVVSWKDEFETKLAISSKGDQKPSWLYLLKMTKIELAISSKDDQNRVGRIFERLPKIEVTISFN